MIEMNEVCVLLNETSNLMKQKQLTNETRMFPSPNTHTVFMTSDQQMDDLGTERMYESLHWFYDGFREEMQECGN